MDTARDAMSISSGTIATLTGFRLYQRIDVVQASFVLFCQDTDARGRWQDHWPMFWSVR